MAYTEKEIGDPSEVIASGTTNGNTLPFTYIDGVIVGGELREITLSPAVRLVSGQSYAITVAGQYESNEGGDYAGWAYEYPSYVGEYVDGYQWFSITSGELWWKAGRGYDFYFVTKSYGTVKDSYTFNPWSAGIYLRYGPELVSQLGQTFLATSNYTLTSVVLQLARYDEDNDNPGTITVSIRLLEGDPEPPSVPPPDIPTFPPPRPDDYDPDLIWTPPTSPIPGNPNTWQDPGLPYQTTGGGRWGRNLVVAGNGKVYYEDYT